MHAHAPFRIYRKISAARGTAPAARAPRAPPEARQSKAVSGSNMTAQQTPRAAISPALKQRASETRSAFANQDAAASKQAHHETIRDWEEDGHGEGDAAVEVYRRVDACSGLCLAVLESAFGSSLERKAQAAIGLSPATAHALREWTTQTWYARHYYRERQREEWELENYAQGERAEMVGLWCYKGLTKPDAERCIDLLASYKKFFVDLMMTEELRMFAPPSDAGYRRITGALLVAAGCVLPLLLGGVLDSVYGSMLVGARASCSHLVTCGSATSALAFTGAWRASTSRLPEQRHALEAAMLGAACYVVRGSSSRRAPPFGA